MNVRMDARKLDRFIDRVDHLPPAPTVMVELLEMFKEPDRDIDRVVELISRDPSLTAGVLKACNSAFLSGGGEVSDMFEAVMRLGFYEVYCLVVTVCGGRMVAMPGVGKEMTNVWSHSLISAVAAGCVARRTEEIEASAYTAGLLHDLGKLVLASVEPARYQPVIAATAGFGRTLIERELELLGVDHAELGGALLTRWQIPANVVAAVQYHHHPAAASEHQRLAAIICLANTIAHGLAEPNSDQILDQASLMEASSILQLSDDSFNAIAEETQAGYERVKGMIGF